MTFGFDLAGGYELLSSIEVYDLDKFLFVYEDEHVDWGNSPASVTTERMTIEQTTFIVQGHALEEVDSSYFSPETHHLVISEAAHGVEYSFDTETNILVYEVIEYDDVLAGDILFANGDATVIKVFSIKSNLETWELRAFNPGLAIEENLLSVITFDFEPECTVHATDANHIELICVT